MLKIYNFNTAGWGRIRTASEAYECSENVNAFIGQSGSGKTTMMDAIRLILGDARFENNRSMDHYIHPKSNWAVVKAEVGNAELEDSPFKRSGYNDDKVTICVRIDNTLNKVTREYYIFDGKFSDITDLGQNPLHYKAVKVKYDDYMSILEEAGITKTFRRLMTMRPEDVQDIINLRPEQLFDKVFQLKGQKSIQETHNIAEIKFKEMLDKEKETFDDLRVATDKFKEFEIKKNKYQEYVDKSKKYGKLDLLLRKRNYYDTIKEIEINRNEKLKAEKQHELLLDEREILLDELYNLNKSIENYKENGEELQRKQKDLNNIIQELNEKAGRLRAQKDSLSYEIKQLEEIEEESIPELKKNFDENRKLLNYYISNEGNLINNKNQLMKEVRNINNGISAIAPWVRNFREQLSNNNIDFIMISDSISVKEEFIPWLNAIEALIGRERYRILVDDEKLLETKKIQEKYRYGARVSGYKKSAERDFRKSDLIKEYKSLKEALEIENYDKIGGYLDRYNDIYLVGTVEEGHRLQLQGHKTITKEGLLQDYDGSISLTTKELVCGIIAREKYYEKLMEDIELIDNELHKLSKQKMIYENIDEMLRKTITLQEKRLELPNLKIYMKNILSNLSKNDEELKEYSIQLDETLSQLSNQNNIVLSLSVEFTKNTSKWDTLLDSISTSKASINGYAGEVTKLNKNLEEFIEALKKVGLDEHAIEFIEFEVSDEKIFIKENNVEWTKDLLQASLLELKSDIDKLSIECRDVNDSIIVMVKVQEERVSKLNDDYGNAIKERKEWEEQLEKAKVALRNHVRETMNQYIEEFNIMADMLGAKSSGKFYQETEDYHKWKVILKIGFDGKVEKPYYDPDLSKGQRAALSIMLLLAAINNNREGIKNSIMFLDEPTSRVDDYRASEIGQILQKSNIQFFITHQVSASLNSVQWIDSSYILSKLRDGEDYADDIIFEARRVVS